MNANRQRSRERGIDLRNIRNILLRKAFHRRQVEIEQRFVLAQVRTDHPAVNGPGYSNLFLPGMAGGCWGFPSRKRANPAQVMPISQVVLDEIAFGEKAMAQLRLKTVESIPLVRVTDEVMELARKVLTSGLLPATADRDATHIALASAYEMDILLSWNCRHIANATIQARLRRLVEAVGLTLPVICTPEELMENEHEQND